MSKSILIAGASRGIGLGLVREFAGRGWAVTGTVRGNGAGAVRDAGGTPETVDLLDPAAVAALAARLTGPFDAILVNAGIASDRGQGIEATPPEQVARVFATNAAAPIAFARAFLPSLAPGGVLAFTSSVMGSVAGNTQGGMELYRASKAALNSLIRSLVATSRPNATVLALHPGWVRTDMGGEGADISVEQSAGGLANVIAGAGGRGGCAFLDYTGATIPW